MKSIQLLFWIFSSRVIVYNTSSSFKILKNKAILNKDHLKPIYSAKSNHLIDCLRICNKQADGQCQIVLFDAFKVYCDIFEIKQLEYPFLVDSQSSNSTIYVHQNYIYLVSLVNYWSFDNTFNDSVGQANLKNNSNTTFVQDRYGNQSSALYLNKSCLYLPDGIYINGDFTLTSWIKLSSFKKWMRLFSIGNGNYSRDTIIFTLSDNQNRSYVSISNSTNVMSAYCPLLYLILNKWQHVAFSLNKTILSFFVDGIQVFQKNNMIRPGNIIRTKNNLGCFIPDSDAATSDFQIDELKMYDIPLNNKEIINDMLNIG